MAPRVLVVREAHTTIAPSVLSELRRRYEVEVTGAICESEIERYALVILFEHAGIEASFELNARGERRGENVILLKESPSVPAIVRALRSGVAAVLPCVDDAGLIVQTCEDVLSNLQLGGVLERLESEADPVEEEPTLLGGSAATEELRRRLRLAAGSSMPVLLIGEAGSGKELSARTIHAASERSQAPFVVWGRGASRHVLLQSELFGGPKSLGGATVLLREVSNLSLELQAALVAALERAGAEPVKSPSPRLIATTEKDLALEVEAGRFSGDLLTQLQALAIPVPPLRARGHDVLVLAHHFLRRASSPARRLMGLTPLAARSLLSYPWPGNVRELEQCIAAAAAIARYDLLREIDLPRHVANLPEVSAAPDIDPLSAIEREHVLTVLRSVRGNKTRASRLLGVDRKTLYRKLESYGLVAEGRSRGRSASINVRGPGGSA
jgi:DNA-binding NtrC family response regulator